MSDKNWFDRLNIEFIKLYGVKRARAAATNVADGVFADFRKVLSKADYNTEVSETYHFEDKKSSVTLRGIKRLGAEGDEMFVSDFILGGKSLFSSDGETEKDPEIKIGGFSR